MFRTYPINYQNILQFVDQVTRKTLPWSIKAPCKSENFDRQISLDADGDDTYCLTLYPIKARNPIKTFTPDELLPTLILQLNNSEFTVNTTGLNQ